jgi:hypothetical protein
MARELPDFNPSLYRVRHFLGRHRDEMADAVIEAFCPLP